MYKTITLRNYLIRSASCLAILLPALSQAYQYTEEEGRVVGRFKLGGAVMDSEDNITLNGVSLGTGFNNDKSGFYSTTFSGEVEMDYFIFDHFSVGGSVGFIPGQSYDISYTPTDTTDTGKITIIPVAAIIKYHIAPYGEIRPYVGGGYSYDIIKSSYTLAKAKNTSGPVFAGGMDWWFSKNWGANFEVNQYIMEGEIDISELTTPLTSDLKSTINPLVLSAGIAYRF